MVLALAGKRNPVITIGTGTNFIEHYACRGTRLIEALSLSPVTKLVVGTGPAKAGVQTISEPEIYQGGGFKIACRYAYPGATAITN